MKKLILLLVWFLIQYRIPKTTRWMDSGFLFTNQEDAMAQVIAFRNQTIPPRDFRIEYIGEDDTAIVYTDLYKKTNEQGELNAK